MKILYYNWAHFDGSDGGGGVTVYQKNLIDGMIRQGHDVYFLCSGIAYTRRGRKPFYERVRNSFGKKCRSFQIVDSPVLAPASHSFYGLKAYLEDNTLFDLFSSFITTFGPFDVIHFNNLEGLSISVLKIKRLFPKTSIIFSLHNYYAFCPQVNLWRCESSTCNKYTGGGNVYSAFRMQGVQAGIENTV